ncbi:MULTISPECIES: hypothetical protein [Prevotellaceae]|jgi:hypothetical protein|uniref:Uncharacterized protein n=2 Tax=Prevotellaceae TaxID=171552 RepID=U2NKQ6_9BACT|nr:MULTISPECIES: hypothetical protein [Prevotellaceae]ALO49099.1 hypothetical protein AS203_08370 [Hoylesella enoeca]ERK38680.1 hypothetical protein HMPREF9135_1856 [Segatella baroniae F0067]MBS5896596.1 hypothetical protein [Segatella buccae]
MAKVVKDLIGKLDREEITNLQCITMHGQEMVDDYKEWCQVLGFDEGDEDGAEQFINELRYGDEPDDNDWPQEVWDKINEVSNEALENADMTNGSNQNKESNLSSVELFQEWRKDKGKLDSLKTSENAVKITLWRYQNPLESKKACARALKITKNNVKKWWNIRYFIDGAIADGGHVHPIRLEHDVIKRTILQAVEIAEKE